MSLLWFSGNISITMPSIMVNAEGSMMLQFTIVGPTQTPSIAYTGRLASDAPGTVRMPLQVPVNSQYFYDGGNEVATLPDGSQVTINRWGDYSSLVVDPTDQLTFWMSNEYPSQLSSVVDPSINVSYAWTTAIIKAIIEQRNVLDNDLDEAPKPVVAKPKALTKKVAGKNAKKVKRDPRYRLE